MGIDMGLLTWIALLQTVATPVPVPAALAGSYNGSQMEMAAGLELHPDGRFEYGLSYGARDETASGRWTASADAVTLESDPVRAPAYAFTDVGAEKAGIVTTRLEVPSGMEPQYFTFLLVGNGIDSIEQRVGTDGETVIHYDPAHPPAAIRVVLPVYQLTSQDFRLDLSKEGRRIEVRFTPNDLGHVMFEDTVLPITGDGLQMERFGRTILFRKQ